MGDHPQLRDVLLGTAIGDSLGLPAEGLNRKRIEKLRWGKPWRQRLIFGRGMCSDDTEHSVMVLQSILEANGDVIVFRKRFSKRLRWWLLGLPAGTGLATARAAIKLWLGSKPDHSGVFSAGNGPAMRSAVIGSFYRDDPDTLAIFVEASTSITHTDRKALVGALAVAELVASPRADAENAFPILRRVGGEDEIWLGLVEEMERCLSGGTSVLEFAAAIGCGDGVGGYVYETVPVAVYAWLFHRGQGGDALLAVLDCGGDTDTVGAITGALCGATSGIRSFPGEWLEGIWEWPRSLSFMTRLANAEKVVPKVFWGFVLLRNVAFLFVVLAHGVLRYFPGGLRWLR